MTLYLIGLGINRDVALSSKILEKLKKCKIIYWENYTSPSPYIKQDIEELLGREIEIINRETLENNLYDFLKRNSNYDFAILVNGDPLIATTHSSIILAAKELGIKYEIYHNSSVITAAIGESGLHIYKFGPFGTIVREEKASNNRNYKILIDNIMKGLHTLFLLEYDYLEKFMLHPADAVEIIRKYDNKEILPRYNPYIIIICGIGFDNKLLRAYKYNKYDAIKKDLSKYINNTPCVIIFTGKLHFTEEEYINKIILEGR